MSKKPNKTICALSNGIVVCMSNTKRQFISYESNVARDIQRFGKSKYQTIEEQPSSLFTRTQQRIYAETVYGLTVFTPEQLKELPGKRRYEIISRFKKAQHVLNLWKQEIVQMRVDSFMSKLFPHSSTVRKMCQVTGGDEKMIDRHTFRELGISQHMVAERLLSAKLLPADFFQLT